MGKYIPGLPIAKPAAALICLFLFLSAQAQKVEVLDSNTFRLDEGVVPGKTSFRGMSVVDDETIWVSGSRGTIARSTDGGKTFHFTQLKGYERSDFRDIEAFDEKRAIIMSSGTPAYILKTVDGGQTWKEVYKNTDTAYFLDAMDFWDEKRGALVADPVNGHFVILETTDGGESWQQLDTAHSPSAMAGEAVFAASGTSLRCWGKDEIGFVTGGSNTSLLFTTFRTEINWQRRKIPMQNGSASQGAFSFALAYREDQFLIVGGDYIKDSVPMLNSFLFPIRGHLNHIKIRNTSSYKSCVENLAPEKDPQALYAVATGTKGTDIFRSFAWSNISPEPFHVVRKAKKGKAVFLAGPKGKIGKLVY